MSERKYKVRLWNMRYKAGRPHHVYNTARLILSCRVHYPNGAVAGIHENMKPRARTYSSTWMYSHAVGDVHLIVTRIRFISILL